MQLAYVAPVTPVVANLILAVYGPDTVPSLSSCDPFHLRKTRTCIGFGWPLKAILRFK
jgi:hypothetical protein